jgi:hypothetical protein
MSDSTPPLQVNLLGFGLMGKQVASLFTLPGRPGHGLEPRDQRRGDGPLPPGNCD